MTPYTLGGASNAPGTGTTLQFTLSHAVAAGDTLVVAAGSGTAAETVTMVTDSQGQTWTSAATDYNQATGVAVFYVQSSVAMTSGVDTVTATFSASAGSHTITGRGCNGIATAGGPDVSVTNDNAGSTSPSSGSSGTLRQSSEWAVAFLCSGNAGGTPSAWSGGFTAIASQHNGTNEYLTAADQTVSATTALTAGATITSAAWAMILVSFRAAPYLAGSNTFTSGSTSTAVTVGAATGSQGVASGDAVLVVCGVGSATVAPSSVTDSSSQTYALVASSPTTNGQCSFIYAKYNSAALTSGVATVTVTWNSTSNNKYVLLVGMNGILTSAAFDQTAGATGTGTAPSSGATPALTVAGEPVLNVVVSGSASVSNTPSPPELQLGSTLHNSGGVFMSVGQDTAPTTAGVTAAATLGASASWSALAATFQPATGGSGGGGAGATLSITTTSPLPGGTVGVAYSDQLVAANGAPPYTWDITVGALQAGLQLTSGNTGGGSGDVTYVGAASGPQGAPTLAAWNTASYGNTGGTGTFGNGLLGPLGCYKFFFSTFPTTWTGTLMDQITKEQPGVFCYICWNDTPSQTVINNFVKTIPSYVSSVGFCWNSEPENTGGSGLTAATFQSGWKTNMTNIHNARTVTSIQLLTIQTAFMGYYQGSSTPNYTTQGSQWIPPADTTDIYGIDLYDRKTFWGSTTDFSGLTAWTRWTGYVKNLGKPLAITEFGISGAGTDAAQNTRLQADWKYVQGAFGAGGSLSQTPLFCWYYWDTGGAGSYGGANINQFLGANSEATWKGVVKSASNQPATATGNGGLIFGTPTVASTVTPTFRVTDSATTTATKVLSLTTSAAGTLTETDTDPLPGATINIAYTTTLSATGGTAPYTFSVNSGTLPTGLSISGNTITGTPTVAGTSTFVIKVTDNVAATALSPTLHLTVSSTTVSITTTSLPQGQLGSVYTATLTATGGTTPYTWGVDGTSPSALPAGLTLDPTTGIISGTPTVSGSFTLIFTVADAAAASAVSTALTMSIATSTGLPAIGRLLFGGTTADWTFTISSGNAQPSAGATVTFWNQSSAGSQYTDLENMSNASISSVTTDSNGYVPQFQGPAGIFEMWADSSGGAGPRHQVRANTGALITILHDYLKTLTG